MLISGDVPQFNVFRRSLNFCYSFVFSRDKLHRLPGLYRDIFLASDKRNAKANLKCIFKLRNVQFLLDDLLDIIFMQKSNL